MAGPPLDGLARSAAAYGVGLTAWLLVTAVRRRPITLHQHAAAALLWGSESAVAVGHGLAALRDRGAPHGAGITLAYAAVAVCVLPLLWPPPGSGRTGTGTSGTQAGGDATTAGATDTGAVRSAGAGPRLAALAAGVTVVVLLRLRAAW